MREMQRDEHQFHRLTFHSKPTSVGGQEHNIIAGSPRAHNDGENAMSASNFNPIETLETLQTNQLPRNMVRNLLQPLVRIIQNGILAMQRRSESPLFLRRFALTEACMSAIAFCFETRMIGQRSTASSRSCS